MNKQIKSDTLKILAMCFMLIDHIGAVIAEPWLMTVTTPDAFEAINSLYTSMRIIGRLSFPIFCYQIVVGMMHTHNRVLYLRNLFVFGLISELPFNLAFGDNVTYFNHQNVFFTLFLGALVICVYEAVCDKYLSVSAADESASDKVLRVFIFTAISLAAAVLAEITNLDYGAIGVLLILTFYVFRNNRIHMSTYGIALFLLEIAVIVYIRSHGNLHSVANYMSMEAYSCLAFPIIYRDNGIRTSSKFFKWFSYCFYPLHLIILYLIKTAIW